MIVYCAVFDNGKKYFGCTTATLKKRSNEHIRQAKRGAGSFFHQALRENEFKCKWKTVKMCSSKEEMFQAEKNFIKRHKSNNPLHGYNRTAGGEFGHCGSVITEKRRLSSKLVSTNLWKDGKMNHLKRKLLNLNTGEVYDSVADASKQLNVSVSSIITCIKKKRMVGKKYFLIDFKENISIEKELNKIKAVIQDRQDKKAKKFSFPVMCLNNKKVYASYKEASKDLKISDAGICRALKEQRPVCGFTFKLVKEDKTNERKNFTRT